MANRGPSPQKGRTYARESYSPEEVRALLEQVPSGGTASEIRNRALIIALWQGGFRIAEALALLPGDWDLKHGEVFVRRGKGGRPRRVSVGGEASAAVAEWLRVRRDRGIPASAPIFCTLRGKPVHDTYVRSMLNRIAGRAGWDKRIHPHGFRHTFAVNLARQGVPAPFIQRQLGHTSMATTTTYLSSISTADIAEAMEKVTW